MFKQNSPHRKYRYSARPYKASLRLVDSLDYDSYEFEQPTQSYVLGNTKNSKISPTVPMYMGNFSTDPYGSYTGIPKDPYDVPVQDADDL